MRLDWAMMADAARVRENVAFIIAGGISNTPRVILKAPGPEGVRDAQVVRFSVAFSLAFVKAEFGREHNFEAHVCDGDGKTINQAKGNIVLPAVPSTGQAPGAIVIPSEVTQIIALDIQFEALHGPGPHSVNIFTNGQLAKQIGFNVV
jgi:hypothetical protein